MKLLSGFSEDQLDDLRGRLVGEQDGGPTLVQRTLDVMDDNTLPRPYDINQVMHDLAGLCRVCLICGYIVDAVLLDADNICESCSRDLCTECGKFCCICEEDEILYGFGDDDFDDDDFDDEMDDFEGDDWEEDEDDDE